MAKKPALSSRPGGRAILGLHDCEAGIVGFAAGAVFHPCPLPPSSFPPAIATWPCVRHTCAKGFACGVPKGSRPRAESPASSRAFFFSFDRRQLFANFGKIFVGRLVKKSVKTLFPIKVFKDCAT